MPISCPGGQVYVIKAGDTLYSIAGRFNTTVAVLLQMNPGINPLNLQIGQQICVPAGPVPCPGGTLYTIKAGDTLYALAIQFNTTVQAIMRTNPGLDPKNLRIGQVICIPVAPVPPVERPFCKLLTPTDLEPNSKGMIFVEPDIRSIVGLVTNVPDPTVFPGGEVFKMWVKLPSMSSWAVTTMTEVFTDYWIGRLVTQFRLAGAVVVISAEAAANTTAPAGIAVATGIV